MTGPKETVGKIYDESRTAAHKSTLNPVLISGFMLPKTRLLSIVSSSKEKGALEEIP
jgi:hypothetical protein